MADHTGGLRRRRVGKDGAESASASGGGEQGSNAGTTVLSSPVPPAAAEAHDVIHDESGADAGAGAGADAGAGTSGAGAGVGSDSDASGSDDDQERDSYDSDGGGGSGSDSGDSVDAPASAEYQQDRDEATADLIMGAIGFVLCTAVATGLPVVAPWVERTTVMLVGMCGIIVTVLVYTFFPPKVPPGESQKYGPLIFLIMGGIGCMVGGMFGSVLKMYVKKHARHAAVAAASRASGVVGGSGSYAA